MPSHVILNVRRLNKLFPEIQITLLTDRKDEANSLLQSCKVVEWEPVQHKELRELKEFTNTGELFWLYTTSRLFAFCEYHSVCGSQALLHVESDVLLASNFPFDKLCDIDRLLWGQYNSVRDVAALLYTPSLEMSKLLEQQMLTQLQNNLSHTDMSLLSAVARNLGSKHAYLPSFNSADSPLINRNSGISEIEIQKNFEMYSFFDGIFDHQTLGMWLDGIDPKHTFGIRENLFQGTVISGESYVDSTRVKYFLTQPFQISVKQDSKILNLYSIHLHSKSSQWFMLNNIDELKERLELVNLHIRSRQMDVKVLFKLIAHNIRSGTLRSWLIHALKRIASAKPR